MNAVIMDNAILGDDCIVGALCFVPEAMIIPARKIAVGNPAKIVKDVSAEMIRWKKKGTALYQQLPAELHATLLSCTPLPSAPKKRSIQKKLLGTWKETKK